MPEFYLMKFLSMCILKKGSMKGPIWEHLFIISDDMILDDQSDLYSLPANSQLEVAEEEDCVNPYPITFPVRKISVPTKLVSKDKRNEEKAGESRCRGWSDKVLWVSCKVFLFPAQVFWDCAVQCSAVQCSVHLDAHAPSSWPVDNQTAP